MDLFCFLMSFYLCFLRLPPTALFMHIRLPAWKTKHHNHVYNEINCSSYLTFWLMNFCISPMLLMRRGARACNQLPQHTKSWVGKATLKSLYKYKCKYCANICYTLLHNKLKNGSTGRPTNLAAVKLRRANEIRREVEGQYWLDYVVLFANVPSQICGFDALPTVIFNLYNSFVSP